MLYDNALLAGAYLEAYQATGRQDFARVVRETLDYLLREMTGPDGGFYSTQDADSEGVEGKFYVWTPEQVHDALGEADAALLLDWYDIRPGGNFEGATILRRPIGGFARSADVDAARQRLFEARTARIRPGLDDKVLTEWNALFLASLAEAAAATDRADWAEAAVRNAEFLLANLRRDDGRWLRAWQEGAGARHLAYAQDHAALVDAFTRLAELTGQRRWLDEAVATADALVQHFWNAEAGTFWTTGDDAEQLLTRPTDLHDNATPSAQSTAALALLRLAPLVDRADLAAIADRVIGALGEVALRHPQAFAHLLHAAELAAVGLQEVVVTGDRPDLLGVVRERWLPHAVVSWGERLDGPLWEGRADDLAYVCRDHVCDLPASTPEQLVGQLT